MLLRGLRNCDSSFKGTSLLTNILQSKSFVTDAICQSFVIKQKFGVLAGMAGKVFLCLRIMIQPVLRTKL